MSRRRWTIIVLGTPGAASRRYVVGVGAFVAGALVLVAALGGGLWAGWSMHGHEPVAMVASEATPEPTPVEQAPPSSTPAPEELRAEVIPSEDDHLLLDVPEVGSVPPDPPILPTIRQTGPRLRLYSLHLGERVEVVPYSDDGEPNGNALEAVAHVMRCRHTNSVVEIHEDLIKLLTDLADLTDNRTIHLVSGFRTPNLRGTSSTSYHTRGMAADIRIAGIGVSRLRQMAIDLGARGIGVYRGDHFVHVDVRETPYRWEG